MLQDISSQAKEHRRAEECLAGNMGLIASSLNRQGVVSFTKRIRACLKDRAGHFEHALR